MGKISKIQIDAPITETLVKFASAAQGNAAEPIPSTALPAQHAGTGLATSKVSEPVKGSFIHVEGTGMGLSPVYTGPPDRPAQLREQFKLRPPGSPQSATTGKSLPKKGLFGRKKHKLEIGRPTDFQLVKRYYKDDLESLSTGTPTSTTQSSPSSATGNTTGSGSDANNNPQLPDTDIENTGKKGQEMKICSEQWLRKHRCKLIMAAVVVVAATILAVYFGTRKEDDTHVVTEGDTHIVTEGDTHVVTEGDTHVITEGMNSSPTEPMEPVISPEDGTEREPTQTLETEPTETSTAATLIGIDSETNRGTLRPAKKSKQLKPLLAILGLFGFVIVLIIGAMMMRKNRRGRN